MTDIHYNNNLTHNILHAEEAMGFKADVRVNLLDEPKTPPHGEGQREYQRHIAIEWEGGVIWLNLFDFATGDYEGDKENRHFCIDVRQFNSAGKVKGAGVFTMARSMMGRGAIAPDGEGNHLRKLMAQALERCQVADDRSGAADEAAAILSSEVNLDGTCARPQQDMPQGHGWNGGYLVSILTDPDGEETHTDDERED
jgi:hypothetical protein